MRDFSQAQQLVITSLTSLKVFLLHEERNKFRPYADLLTAISISYAKILLFVHSANCLRQFFGNNLSTRLSIRIEH